MVVFLINMNYKIAENISGKKQVYLENDKDEADKRIVVGLDVLFLKGSDCPSGEFRCFKINNDGIIKFERKSSDTNVLTFSVHIEDILGEIERGYINIGTYSTENY